MVIPGPRSSGYVATPTNTKSLIHESGIGNGDVTLEVLNDLIVEQNSEYKIFFKDSLQEGNKKIPRKNYSVLKLTPVEDRNIAFYDTNFTKLSHQFISDDSYLEVRDENGNVYSKNLDYVINFERGIIRRTSTSSMSLNKKYIVKYRYYPVYQSQLLNGEDGNPVIDGLKLKVVDHPALKIDSIRTKWIKGKCNYTFRVEKATIGGKIIPNEADYEIHFSNSYIDSAMILVAGRLVKIPVKYSVKEVTTGVPRPILTYLKENALTRDSNYTAGEEIVLFKFGSTGKTTDTTTWGVIFYQPSSGTPVPPSEGDVFYIRTLRPFKPADVFYFKTEASKFDVSLAKSRLDNIIVVPNPYVVVNDIEPTNKLPGQNRGERRIYFENLPSECTIRIYTLAGELVQTIYHSSSLENGREFWNLLNRDGFSVAYGIYFAHIDAPGIGEKLLKFAIIK